MPVSVRWDNERKTIIRFIFWNEWETEQYIEAFNEALAMIENVSHIVDIINDMRTESFIPKGDTVALFRNIIDSLPENAGIIVYVNNDVVQQRLYTVQSQFYQITNPRKPKRLFMVESLKEANQLITKAKQDRRNKN